MGIESASYLDGLDSAWPLGSDPIAQGDNHVRLLKAVLKATFPGAGGAGFSVPITATEAEINRLSGVTSGIQAQLNTKAPLASPTLTGTPLAPTAAGGTNTTQIATTAFVTAALASKAPLVSPTFTGTPTAPTAAAGTDTAQIATTAFVQAEFTDKIATQAEMEAMASNSVLVTPGRMKSHPLMPKISLKISAAKAIAHQSGGVASITDNGNGRLTINLSTPFSNATGMYVIATAYDTAGGAGVRDIVVTSYSTSAISLKCTNAGGSYADPDEWMVLIYGDF
jgi:hypothetical protein